MSLFKGEAPILGTTTVIPTGDTDTAITVSPQDTGFSGSYVDCQNSTGTSIFKVGPTGVITLAASSSNIATTSSTVGNIGTKGYIKVMIGSTTRYIGLGDTVS